MKAGDIIDCLLKGQSLIRNCVTDQDFIQSIQSAGEIMSEVINEGGKIFSCGNGGSMSDAMHFASELTGRYKETRDPIAAMALSDPGAMSCIANDFGYQFVFQRQITALGSRGDVLLAISTSGLSENILRAVLAAKEKGIKVVGLSGSRGISRAYCDVEIKVPSLETGLVQQIHIMVIHMLVEIIEKNVNYYKP